MTAKWNLLAVTGPLRTAKWNLLPLRGPVRVATVLGVLHDQVVVIETPPSRCLARFRLYLGSASGARSAQFHELDRRLDVASTGSPVEAAFLGAVSAAGLELVDHAGRIRTRACCTASSMP